MKYEKSCGAIVIDDNKVLLVKHVKGHIDFPKGHVEDSETEEETAIREVKEETNIDIIVDNRYRYVVNYFPRADVSKEVVFFIGKKVSGKEKRQEEEISEIYWVDINEAMQLITFDKQKELFKKVLEDIKKNIV